MIVFVLIGTAVMLCFSLLRREKYGFSLLKSIILTLLLTVSGVIGAKAMFMIESGSLNFSLSGGISFYGSLLFIPLLSIPIALLSRTKYLHLLDFYAPEVCAMLAVMKINCLKEGCCSGITLFHSAGSPVHFPSQIVECTVSFAIMVLLFYLENNQKFKGRLFPIYLVVYGVIRFALNFFREGLTPFVWIIPAGHFWSLLSIITGILILLIYRRKAADNAQSSCA